MISEGEKERKKERGKEERKLVLAFEECPSRPPAG